MQSISKQSHKLGALVTKEIHLGADGPLIIKLKDQVSFELESGDKITLDASDMIQAFKKPVQCPVPDHGSIIKDMLQRIQALEQQLAIFSSVVTVKPLEQVRSVIQEFHDDKQAEYKTEDIVEVVVEAVQEVVQHEEYKAVVEVSEQVESQKSEVKLPVQQPAGPKQRGRKKQQ